MRYFLIDKVTELVIGERVRGLKCVTLSDPILHDHFPDYPTMPGALIIEAAAQLAGFLIEMTVNRTDEPLRRALLAQIELAKFHDRVGPGSIIAIAAQLINLRDSSAQVVVEASVDERVVARAKLILMLQTVDSEKIHDQRRYLYQLWTRDLQLTEPIL